MRRLVEIGTGPLPGESSVKVDRYGTLDFRLGLPLPRGVTPLYWVLEDPVFSFVEVGLNPATGGLCSLTIPLYNGELESWQEGSQIPEGESFPLFDMSLWPEEEERNEYSDHFYHYAGRCTLQCGQGCFRIQLFPEKTENWCTLSESAIAELNGRRELIAVTFLREDAEALKAGSLAAIAGGEE